MTPSPVPSAVWTEEGRRTAPALADIAAALVIGRDPEAAAAVALGIAAGCAHERRVAVADLVGGLPALTPLDDQPGLLECLRDGEPVSGIGQPWGEVEGVYLLPSGRGPIAERWVFESARWERLVAGFREVDALLLLVAPAAAPGLSELVERVDGVIAVDLPPAEVRAWPIIATVDHPEPELPPIAVTPRPGAQAAVPGARNGGRRGGRRIGRWVVGGLALVIAATVAWMRGPGASGTAGDASGDAAVAEDSLAGAAAPATPPSAPAAREVRLGPPVNPGDSVSARRWSVELVAANTPEGANSRLVWEGDPLPVPTIAPVVLRAGSAPWYRVVVGAWESRADAERWLQTQRALGLIRPAMGRVLETPFALQLAAGPLDEVETRRAEWTGGEVQPYLLRQDDGHARVLVGAFETASQALWFAATLRERGLEPQLAYRTGRTF
ncbi:MAG: SPOR domain-containing protein [Gemmatimonadaceae bacterium]|nr:SPOR domain-containing protein [Gemmatimonadaceae bacterium]MCW5827352.1 SPOR domain-containing protein [Gemmatimonadaceae bacterium]